MASLYLNVQTLDFPHVTSLLIKCYQEISGDELCQPVVLHFMQRVDSFCGLTSGFFSLLLEGSLLHKT